MKNDNFRSVLFKLAILNFLNDFQIVSNAFELTLPYDRPPIRFTRRIEAYERSTNSELLPGVLRVWNQLKRALRMQPSALPWAHQIEK